MKYNKYYSILIIFAIGLLGILDLFHPGLPLTHDGKDHVARIANFYLNLSEGNIIPRWAPNLNWGYGHPILMFLYPLPSYLASFFHFFGFNFVDSLKLVFGISFIASAFAMYLWIREFLDEQSGIVAATLYIFAPYRFVDLYVRGAIGEHVAFIFPPLICFFLLKISKRYSYWYFLGCVLSIAGLILSHNAITLMFLPIVMFYALYLLCQNKDKKQTAIRYTLIAILGLGIASFFWAPAFFEGKYTLRDIVTKNEYSLRFVLFKDFLYGPWSYGGTGQFTVQIGIVQWLLIFATPFTIFFWKKKKNPFWILTTVLFFVFFITLYIMTKESLKIWEIITTLQKFQFPWRFLTVTVFLTAVLGGFFISSLQKNAKSVVIICIIIATLFLSRDYWHAYAFSQESEKIYTSIYHGTTDTGESAPIWSVRFMENPPKSRIELIGGDAIVIEGKRTTTEHIYKIDVKTNIAQIRENTLYFPGWEVLVNNKAVEVEFQDPKNRGVMTFVVPQGEHVVRVLFKETKLRFVSDMVSFSSLVIVVILGILRKAHIWKQFQLF